MTYESLDSQRIVNRLHLIGKMIADNYSKRRNSQTRTYTSENIIVYYKDFDVLNDFAILANLPSVLDIDLDLFVKTKVSVNLDVNIYNYFLTLNADNGSAILEELNTITMVVSGHRCKNTQYSSTGELISPVVDLSFYFPDRLEKEKILGNF